jgi:biopolymer transport protein ExbD
MLRRRRYRASASGPEFSSTSVFITPMLDMSFQILAFFVVTFNPPALEGRLPWDEVKGKQGGPNPVQQSTDAKPTTTTELPPPLTVTAYADSQGRLRGLVLEEENKPKIRLPDEDNPRPAADRAEAEKLISDLQDALLKLKPTYSREKRITVRLDKPLLWDFTILVMDACRSYRSKSGRETELFPKIETDLFDHKR